jgi:hypothetical protein
MRLVVVPFRMIVNLFVSVKYRVLTWTVFVKRSVHGVSYLPQTAFSVGTTYLFRHKSPYDGFVLAKIVKFVGSACIVLPVHPEATHFVLFDDQREAGCASKILGVFRQSFLLFRSFEICDRFWTQLGFPIIDSKRRSKPPSVKS